MRPASSSWQDFFSCTGGDGEVRQADVDLDGTHPGDDPGGRIAIKAAFVRKNQTDIPFQTNGHAVSVMSIKASVRLLGALILLATVLPWVFTVVLTVIDIPRCFYPQWAREIIDRRPFWGLNDRR